MTDEHEQMFNAIADAISEHYEESPAIIALEVMKALNALEPDGPIEGELADYIANVSPDETPLMALTKRP